jgi:hypothetical protein
MNTSYNNTQPKLFFPHNISKVVERTTTVSQNKDGSTIRTMSETVIVENNEDVIVQLLAENKDLNRQLEEAHSAPAIINFENWVILAFCAFIIYWKVSR